MSEYQIGWNGAVAWSGGDLGTWDLTGASIYAALSDNSTTSYIRAVQTSSTVTGKLYSSTTEAVIPTGSTVTSVDSRRKSERISGSGISQEIALVSVDSGGAESSVTDSAALALGVNNYSTNWPSPPQGGSWTVAKFFQLAGAATSSGYFKISQTAGSTASNGRCYDLWHKLTFAVPAASVTNNSVTGYTISARVKATLSGVATSGYTTLSRVRYGTSTGSYPSTTNGTTYSSDFSTEETITLSGLSASTTYYCVFETVGPDATTTSSEMSFTTSAGDAGLMVL